MTEQEIIRLKQQADTAKENAAKYKAQLEMKQEELKETWKCTTIEQAQKKIAEMEKEAKEKEEAMEEKLLEIKETYFNETAD